MPTCLVHNCEASRRLFYSYLLSPLSQDQIPFDPHYRCEFWCRDFGSELLEIVFAAISLPLDEILESSPVPTAVEYLLYFPLCFSVNDYGQWVIFHFLACNWVVQGQSELYYVEHQMELLHPMWQPQVIGHRSDLPFYYKGAKSSM